MARQRRRNLTVELTDEQADALFASALEQYEAAEVLAEQQPRTRRQAAIVPPHFSESSRCIHCGTYHTLSQHWSHADAAREPDKYASYLCKGCGSPLPTSEPPASRTRKATKAKTKRKPKKTATKKKSKPRKKPQTRRSETSWSTGGMSFQAVPLSRGGWDLFSTPTRGPKVYIGLQPTLKAAQQAADGFADIERARAPKRKRASTKKKTATKSKTTRKKAAAKKKTSTRKSTTTKKAAAKRSTKKTTAGRTQKVAASKTKKKAAPRKKTTKKKTSTRSSSKKKAARPKPSGTDKRAASSAAVTWQRTAPRTYSGALYGPDRMTLFSARENPRGRWELLVDEGGFSADKKLGTFPSLADAQEGAVHYLAEGKAKVTKRRKRPKTGKPPTAPTKLSWTEVAPRRFAGSARGFWFSVFRNGGPRWKLEVGEGRAPDTLVGEYPNERAAKKGAEAFLAKAGKKTAA